MSAATTLVLDAAGTPLPSTVKENESRSTTPEMDQPPLGMTPATTAETETEDGGWGDLCDPVGTGGIFYTVAQHVLAFVRKPAPTVPEQFQGILEMWRRDEWNHLYNPPDALEAHHYLVCFTSPVPNDEMITKFMRASNNLAMAKARSAVMKGQAPNPTTTGRGVISYPEASIHSTRSFREPNLIPVITKLTEAAAVLSETARGLGRDADRNAMLFRTAMTDTTQGVKTIQLSLMKEVEAITGAVARSSTFAFDTPTQVNPSTSNFTNPQGQKMPPPTTPS